MRRLLLTTVLLSAVATAAAAQWGPGARLRPQAGPAPLPGQGVEEILRLRERLELTQDQVARLHAMREQALAARIGAAAEMMRIQSELRAGEISREQARTRLQARRDSTRRQMETLGPARIREVLTEAQRERLLEARREAVRAEARMRMQRFRGREPVRDPPRLRRLPWR
jgi:hypothetical protein